MKKGILDAKELAGYIKYNYKQANNIEISPIKLQKSLYFLFAYWGGMVRKAKNNPDYVEDKRLLSQNERLYDDIIQAWVYGPVIPEVYREKNLERFYKPEKDIFNGNIFLKETIDSILNDVFVIPDFKLVSISHEDKSWQNNFSIIDATHEKEISKEEIINEYAQKEFI